MHGSSRTARALVVGMLLSCWAAAGAQQQERASVVQGLPKTIPLPLLLGNAKYRNPQMDNFGNFMSFLKPDANGVMNLFVQPVPQGPKLQAFNKDVGLLEQLADQARQVTFDTKRGVSAYSWAQDDSTIFFLQDSGGDENFHLFVVPVADPSTGAMLAKIPAATDLTPFPGVKVQGINTSERVPKEIYFSMNKRNPESFDLYSFNLDSKEMYLHTVNPGDVATWLVDFEFNLRGVENYNSSDGATYIQINDALPTLKVTDSSSSSSSSNLAIQEEKGSSSSSSSSSASLTSRRIGTLKGKLKVPQLFAAAAAGNWTLQQWIDASTTSYDLRKWRVLLNWPFGDENGVFRFNRAGDAVYGTASPDDRTELVLYSTAPGAKILKRIASSKHSNVGSVIFEPLTWEPQMVSFNYLRPQWVFLDPTIKAMWEKLQAFHPDRDPSLISRTEDSKTWIVSFNADNATTAMYLYNVGAWPPHLLLKMQPQLDSYQLANMHTVVIPARDGLRIPGYLTLPHKPGVPEALPPCVVGSVPDLTPAMQKAVDSSPLKCPLNLKLPMLLFVHGGPWSRDTWGADSVVQFLANRGYAVLQVNYRGSTGYGQKFTNAGNRQWGVGTMQHDLTDSLRWAIEKGIADPAKTCIFGASYGGYATLAGLTFTPELYACGVDLVGLSNVATFLKSIPPYWKPLRVDFVNRVGDAETNATLNHEISPVFHVDKIRAPLLMGQGANDPRVPKKESDQMFAAMKQKGLDVEYVLYTDEGHGLVRSDNRIDFYSRMEQFLKKHLGGRAEPLSQPKGANVQVITKV